MPARGRSVSRARHDVDEAIGDHDHLLDAAALDPGPDAVVEAFASNGRLRVVKPEDADAILDGEVVGYSVQSIAFDNQANVRQYRLMVTMNLRLRDVRRSSILFEQQSLREKADFQVQGAVSQTIGVEEGAVRSAATEIARSIVSLTVDRF